VVEPIATVSCKQPRSLARAPLPQEVGVYRAGPLLLVTGQDLAQLADSQFSGWSASEAIAVVTGSAAASRSGADAALVMVEVAGRFVTLSPPTDAPDDHM
jgi:hypothetical protein